MKSKNTIDHLAIIMDGNSRWAKAKNLPTSTGHKQGAEAARKIVESCANNGIKFLTLYTFSSENWSRPEGEVKDLLNLLKIYLDKEAEKLIKKNVRLKFIGDLSAFDSEIQNQCGYLEKKSCNNDLITINIALNYGGRQEIVNACKQLQKEGAEINLENISKHLYTADIPEPDLLIRTAGDHRISNFLIWQTAYTELYFTETLWPDFDGEALDAALEDYTKRERRFGGR